MPLAEAAGLLMHRGLPVSCALGMRGEEEGTTVGRLSTAAQSASSAGHAAKASGATWSQPPFLSIVLQAKEQVKVHLLGRASCRVL